MIAKPVGHPAKSVGGPPRPAGRTASGPPPRRATAAAASGRSAVAAPVVGASNSSRNGLMFGFALVGLAIFAVIRIVGSGDSAATRTGIEGRISQFESGKAPGEINYNDPVYGKAIEDLRTIATGPGATSEAANLLQDLETKQRTFEARMRENQARMEATLAAQDARLAAETARQKETTGTDPGAAARLAASSHLTCLEENH